MQAFRMKKATDVLKGCQKSSWMLKQAYLHCLPKAFFWWSCIWEVWFDVSIPLSIMNSNLIITLQLCKHVTDATEIHTHVDLWWRYSSTAALPTTLKYWRKWPSQKQTNKFQRQKCLPKWPCPSASVQRTNKNEWSFLDGWAERVILEQLSQSKHHKIIGVSVSALAAYDLRQWFCLNGVNWETQAKDTSLSNLASFLKTDSELLWNAACLVVYDIYIYIYIVCITNIVCVYMFLSLYSI